MTYMQRWVGSTDPDDTSGEAHFMIEAQPFVITMPHFKDAQRINELMALAFRQGKSFAFRAIKGHISGALDRADSAHSLTLPADAAREPSNG